MSYYLQTKVLDDVLIDYLNIEENANNLSEVRIDSEYRKQNEDFDIKILRDIIESSNIELKSYESLIKNIGYWYTDLDISNIDEEKIILLIKYGKFQFKKECFDTLKEYSSYQHIALIEKYSDKLLEKFDDFIFDASDILKLLNSPEFTKEKKYQIIDKVNIDILEDNQPLREKVSKFYIDDNKDIANNELFEKLFYNTNELKMELLVSQIEYFDCSDLSSYLEELDKPYNELLIKSSKKLYLEDTEINSLLLKEFVKNDYISSFSKHKTILGKKELKVETRRGCN